MTKPNYHITKYIELVGGLAQSVERRNHNPCVVGSNPSPATNAKARHDNGLLSYSENATMENRIINIEIALAELQKTVDELNLVVIDQAKKIESLQKINRYLLDNIEKDVVKPLSEETPPPHY